MDNNEKTEGDIPLIMALTKNVILISNLHKNCNGSYKIFTSSNCDDILKAGAEFLTAKPEKPKIIFVIDASMSADITAMQKDTIKIKTAFPESIRVSTGKDLYSSGKLKDYFDGACMAAEDYNNLPTYLNQYRNLHR